MEEEVFNQQQQSTNLNSNLDVSTDKLKDITGLPKQLLYIPSKNNWQEYSLWRVNMFKSNVLIYYSGKLDGVITVSMNGLRNVLTSVENDVGTSQEKTTYQFQLYDSNYISRCLQTRKGSQNEGIVPFRYIRANLKSRRFLLFQNSFTVKPNSYELEHLTQSTVISCTYEELMDPYPHISTPSLNVKFKQDVYFENDID